MIASEYYLMQSKSTMEITLSTIKCLTFGALIIAEKVIQLTLVGFISSFAEFVLINTLSHCSSD
ncbi:unnamed protein product, partial [Hymenolepis diminuta]